MSHIYTLYKPCFMSENPPRKINAMMPLCGPREKQTPDSQRHREGQPWCFWLSFYFLRTKGPPDVSLSLGFPFLFLCNYISSNATSHSGPQLWVIRSWNWEDVNDSLTNSGQAGSSALVSCFPGKDPWGCSSLSSASHNQPREVIWNFS